MQVMSKASAVLLAVLLGAVIALPQPGVASTGQGKKANSATVDYQRRKNRTGVNVRIRKLGEATANKRRSKAAVASTGKTKRKLAARRLRVGTAIAAVRTSKRTAQRQASLARRKSAARNARVIGAFVDGRSLLDVKSSAHGPRNGVRPRTVREQFVGNGQGRRKERLRVSQAAIANRYGRHSFVDWSQEPAVNGGGSRSDGLSLREWLVWARFRRGRD